MISRTKVLEFQNETKKIKEDPKQLIQIMEKNLIATNKGLADVTNLILNYDPKKSFIEQYGGHQKYNTIENFRTKLNNYLKILSKRMNIFH